MQYFTVQGSTPREALSKMKHRYGPDARIHSHRAVRMGGVLGLFARQGVEITGFVEPARSEIAAAAAPELDREKHKILQQTPSGAHLQRLVDEVAALRARLDESLPEHARITVRRDEHPRLAALEALLERNDFAPQYRARLIDQVRAEFRLQQLEDESQLHQFVAQQIGRELVLATPLAERTGAAAGPRICTIVGPTGVGKTTTIAKLAAIHGIGGATEPAGKMDAVAAAGAVARARNVSKVRIVTIDNYRIGARQQIETYGEIMRIPVTAAETGDDLKKALALGQSADLIFIDTVGRSPGDYARLAEMRSVLDAVGRRSTTQLAISASTKYPDLEEIMRQFEPFAYASVIVTKLDETATIGNVLSALALARKPVSYLSDGQVVPQDIEPASILRLLLSLDGFRLDRRWLEQEFGTGIEPDANGTATPLGHTSRVSRAIA